MHSPVEAYINSVGAEIIYYAKELAQLIGYGKISCEIGYRATDWFIRRQEYKRAFEGLFDFLGRASISPGDINKFRRGPTEGDTSSAKTLTRLVHRHFRNNREETFVQSCGEVELSENLCSVGGPVSHMLTRLAMGYPADLSGNPRDSVLPYIFNVDHEALGFPRIKAKISSTMREFEEPNWYIMNAKTRVAPFGKPELDGTILKDDFLLLTVMPNTLSQGATQAGKKHFIISGAHDFASSVIGDVMNNAKVISEIRDQASGSAFFQTIIKVRLRYENKRYSVGKWWHLKTEPF